MAGYDGSKVNKTFRQYPFLPPESEAISVQEQIYTLQTQARGGDVVQMLVR